MAAITTNTYWPTVPQIQKPESKSNESFDLLPQKTKGKGNCAFHAAFGVWNRTEFIAPNADKMRETFINFLSSFRNLAEMPESLRAFIQPVLQHCYEGEMDHFRPSPTLQALFNSVKTFCEGRERVIKEIQSDFFRKIIDHILQYDEIGKAMLTQILFELLNADENGQRKTASLDLRKLLHLEKDLKIPIDISKIVEKINAYSFQIKRFVKSREKDIGTVVNGSSMIDFYIPLLPFSEKMRFEELKGLVLEDLQYLMDNLLNVEILYQEYLKHIRENGNDYYLWFQELAVLAALSGKKIKVMTRDSRTKDFKLRMTFEPNQNLLTHAKSGKKFAYDPSIFPLGNEVVICNTGWNHYERMISMAELAAKEALIPNPIQNVNLIISKLIDQLEEGLKERNTPKTSDALKKLDQPLILVDRSPLSNPLEDFTRLLSLIGGDLAEGRDPRIKREIASVSHHLLHVIYYRNKEKDELINPATKKNLLEQLQASRKRVPKTNPVRNGLKFELQVMELGIGLLSDLLKKEQAIEFAKWLLDAAQAVKELDAKSALDLVIGDSSKRIIDYVSQHRKKNCYEQIKWMEIVGQIATKNNDAFKHLLNHVKAQKLEGSWHILYAGLKSLQKVIEKNENNDIKIEAFDTILTFWSWGSNKYIQGDFWRIREKVAECAWWFYAHPLEKIRTKSDQIRKQMKEREKHERVLRTLNNPELVSSIKDLLEKNWEPEDSEPSNIIDKLDSLDKLMELTESQMSLQNEIVEGLTGLGSQLAHQAELTERKLQSLEKLVELAENQDEVNTQIKNKLDEMGRSRKIEELISSLKEMQIRKIMEERTTKFFIPLEENLNNEFIDALKTNKVIVLWGEQGSGKTCHLQNLISTLWNDRKLEDPIPLYVDLTEIDPSFKDLMRQILNKYKIDSEEEVRKLKEKKIILVLDNYDKLKLGKYENLYDRLSRTHEWDIQFVFSCTSNDIPSSAFIPGNGNENENYKGFQLKLLNQDQQQQFYDKSIPFHASKNLDIFRNIPVLGPLLSHPLILSILVENLKDFVPKIEDESKAIKLLMELWVGDRIRKMGIKVPSSLILRYAKEIALWMIQHEKDQIFASQFNILLQEKELDTASFLKVLPLRKTELGHYEFLDPMLKSFFGVLAFIEAADEMQTKKTNKSNEINQKQIDALALVDHMLETPGLFEFFLKMKKGVNIEKYLKDVIASLAKFPNLKPSLAKVKDFLNKIQTLKSALPKINKLPKWLQEKMGLPEIPQHKPELSHLPHLPWEQLKKIKNIIKWAKNILSYAKKGLLCAAGTIAGLWWYFRSPNSTSDDDGTLVKLTKHAWSVASSTIMTSITAVGGAVWTYFNPPQSSILSKLKTQLKNVDLTEDSELDKIKSVLKNSMKEISTSKISEDTNDAIHVMADVLRDFPDKLVTMQGLKVINEYVQKMELSKNYKKANEAAKKGLNLALEQFGDESIQTKAWYEKLESIAEINGNLKQAKDYGEKVRLIKDKFQVQEANQSEEFEILEQARALSEAQALKEQFYRITENMDGSFAVQEKIIDDIPILKKLGLMVAEDAKFKEKLWQFVIKSKKILPDINKDKKSVILASNAISILNAARVSFSKEKLSRIRVPHADLRNSNFYGADLTKADLSGVKFQQSILAKAKFNKANLENVQWGESAKITFPSEILKITKFNNQFVVTVCQDGTITVFNENKEEIYRFNIDEGNISHAAFDKHGNKLIVKVDNGIKVVQLDKKGKWTKKIIYNTEKSIETLVTNDDGKFLAFSDSKIITIVDTETNKVVNKLSYEEPINQLAFTSIDGKAALAGVYRNNNIVKVLFWDIFKKNIVYSFTWSHPLHFATMTISENGEIMALGGAKEGNIEVVFWDIKEGKIVKILKANGVTPSAMIKNIFLSQDLNRICLADWNGKILILDVKTGEIIENLMTGENNFTQNTYNPSLQFLKSEGQQIVIGTGHTLQYFSSLNPKPFDQKTTLGIDDNYVAFSPDQKYIFLKVRGFSNSNILFDVDSGKMIKNIKTFDELALSVRNNNHLAFNDKNPKKEKIVLWDYNENKEIWSDNSIKDGKIHFFKNRDLLMVYSKDRVLTWNGSSGANRKEYKINSANQVVIANDSFFTIEISSNQIIVKNLEQEIETDYSIPGDITHYNFKINDRFLMAFTDEEGILINLATKKNYVFSKDNNNESKLYNYIVNDDNKLSGRINKNNKNIYIWDNAGTLFWKSTDNNALEDRITLDSEGVLRLWDNNEKLISSLGKDITSYKLSNNGKKLTTSHFDSSIRLWDVDNFIEGHLPKLLWSTENTLDLFEAPIVDRKMAKEIQLLMKQKGAIEVRTEFSFDYGNQLLTDKKIIQQLAGKVISDSDFKQFLWEIVKDSRQKIENDSEADKKRIILASNAMTVLNRARVSFSGKKLKRIRIPGADLSGGLFDHADFRGADLSHVNFARAWLNEAKFEGANKVGMILNDDLDVVNSSKPIVGYLNEVILYSPDGLTYLTGGKNKSPLLWDATTKESFQLDGYKAKYSVTGKWVVGYSSTQITIYNAHKKEKHSELKMRIEEEPLFSPSGHMMVLLERGVLSFWGVGTWKKLTSIRIIDPQKDEDPKLPVFSTDGKKLYISNDQSMLVFDVSKVYRGKRPVLLERHGLETLQRNGTLC